MAAWMEELKVELKQKGLGHITGREEGRGRLGSNGEDPDMPATCKSLALFYTKYIAPK